MAAVTGRAASIRLVTDSVGNAIKGLISWSTDAPATIDVTVAGNDGFTKQAVGLKSGTITAELIVDADDTNLVAALADGFEGVVTTCYFRVNDPETIDAGATPVAADYAWDAYVVGSLTTGGPGDTAKRTITFYRQAEAA